MPYTVSKMGDMYAIIRNADGKVVGKSKTKQKADASVRARMSGEKKK